jgi:hypothetical protein
MNSACSDKVLKKIAGVQHAVFTGLTRKNASISYSLETYLSVGQKLAR